MAVEYKVPPPSGYEAGCAPDADGWPRWKVKEGGSCPSCGAVDDPDADDEPDQRLFALECPTCDEVGCDLCFPMGRGCDCPACEEGGDDEG